MTGNSNDPSIHSRINVPRNIIYTDFRTSYFMLYYLIEKKLLFNECKEMMVLKYGNMLFVKIMTLNRHKKFNKSEYIHKLKMSKFRKIDLLED